MDKERLLYDLQQKHELEPDSHDGSYELMRETIAAYSSLEDYSQVTYKDLDVIYLMAIGTWRINIEKKKERIKESCLSDEQKNRLKNKLDEVWGNACHNRYENHETQGKTSVGMFGAGFFSFKTKTSDECAKSFVKMCVDISKMSTDDEDDIFDRVDETLKNGMNGMQAAAASEILHCIMPTAFPVLNGYIKRIISLRFWE